ncbi:MAG: decaprenyl-phosphate phosphoribosyltransferase [Ignavibacteriales bacterium]|nr:decaprenyl-phosphate phosphoribosyltransferase [Ignavibacteriales bacterium]
MLPLIRLLRPLQWLKNGFVFTPLIFSRHMLEKEYNNKATLAFVAFCLVSSAIYILNDIVDAEADKLHPVKRKRPIASGEISVATGIGIAIILLSTSLLISQQLPLLFTGIIITYIFLQLFYSFKLKHVVILDVFIIALGFMLRVVSGAVAIDVVISNWIIITTLFVSLFLAVSKRRSELVMVQGTNIETKRKVLDYYSVQFLDYALIISATGMAISYSLYTMAERTISVFGTEHLIFTIVFVLFGIFRYLYLVINKGQGENPTSILVKDAPMGINLLLWTFSVIFIIYFS